MDNQKDQARYTISVAARLTGVQPQSLRDYENKGLLDPQRTAGKTRLYSDEDLRAVGRIQALIGLGVNLVGVRLIVRLEDDLEDLQTRFSELEDEIRAIGRGDRRPG